MWRDYPDEVKSFQESLKTDPAELALSNFKKILPPPIKNNQQAIEKAYQAGQFFYTYYGTDANCWRSGELTAMIAPAIITLGGTLGPKMVSRLVGRLSKKVVTDGKLLDIVSLFRQGRKINYDDIGEIQQVIIRNEDEIDGIYEKVGDELVPICGFTPTGGRVSSSRRCPKIRFTGEALAELSTRLGGKFDEMVDLLDKLTPRASHTLKLENGKLKLVDADGVAWLENITGTQVIAKGGNKPFNKFLDGFPPMKNFEYVIDGNFRYKTDELGRVEKITVENLAITQPRERSPYQQQKAKDLKDGKLTDGINDDGGHMVASQFWGPSEQINYFPQNAAQNRAGGQWYEMEQELKQLRLDNPTATIKVEIVPEFSGTSKRPDRFIVDVEINGVAIPVPYRISNP